MFAEAIDGQHLAGIALRKTVIEQDGHRTLLARSLQLVQFLERVAEVLLLGVPSIQIIVPVRVAWIELVHFVELLARFVHLVLGQRDFKQALPGLNVVGIQVVENPDRLLARSLTTLAQV